MEVTFGGDRIGSGAGMKVAMHNYEMSTHNLSQRFTSTMGCGTLIPCLCIPAMRGDYFDIDINAQARTIPTRGPLFSTFKMQVDLYDVPMRLYQALLHNNAIRLGMNMSKVKLPKLRINTAKGEDLWSNGEFASNSLLKYLGMSGIGRARAGGETSYYRYINAIPALAYYDIFKNYYANKQEPNAYMVTIIGEAYETNITSIVNNQTQQPIDILQIKDEQYNRKAQFYAQAESDKIYDVTWVDDLDIANIDVLKWSSNLNMFIRLGTLEWAIDEMSDVFVWTDVDSNNATLQIINPSVNVDEFFVLAWNMKRIDSKTGLQSFTLENIDEMRLDLLSFHTLGSSFQIGELKQTGDKDVYLPYSSLTGRDGNGVTFNQRPLNGICVKTYQSDLFNNWLNTEWVEGENGIAEMSKVAVTDGAIYMDALLFAKKTYNLLNRVAVSDGTYQSWLDAVYTESPKRHIETPMFVGGLSTEIVFEEIVQTTPTDGKALGTLGGRGILVKRKGGNAYIECDEPSFIIGIVSITPRIFYTQGNEFYMTELDSIDDLHKPEYDGIGFQNLLGERLCWPDTVLNANGTIYSRTVVGKVPAWIEYMTAVDKAYGEFTDVNKQGFMVLNRNYSINENGEVVDFTTYVDPSKYNYAFGESTLFSQNFWVQIQFDIKARRKMSAREIPNL